MAIKPWYKVVTPREDLREGRPLDASEFAVHLDHVRDGRAGEDYQNPERFFERTFLSKNLTQLASEVVRRLSGITTETSAVFNMSTQFGGGKTHSLTLLYHLAKNGNDAQSWIGVNKILANAGITSVPTAATAVFVGTEFDSVSGRGGDDGTPKRHTPWGEIAWQLRGLEGYNIVRQQDEGGIAPAGDVIRKLFNPDSPCLILMDEVMNYVGRNLRSGLAAQLYDFIQCLSETARGEKNVALVVSIPSSEILEVTPEEQQYFERLKKNLNRLGKAIVISSENETIEIIRRRLFEWDTKDIAQSGKISLNKDAVYTCNEYSDWVIEHRNQIPNWFPFDTAREMFQSCYPFHPSVISVFERKWQALPRFQQTRGILRLLALWVSNAYVSGFKGAQNDGLIGLGTAPLDDSLFRQAMFEELGENRLEVAVTTDIIGKSESFAQRLDKESIDSIKKTRLHQKVAASIFFESSGGQQTKTASLPEIRLAVSEPSLDIGNVETALDDLIRNCYYLIVDKNSYKFGLTPNLNKLLSDRQANVSQRDIDELLKEEITKIFVQKNGIGRILFPEKTNDIPDRAELTIVVLGVEKNRDDKTTHDFIERCTRDYGNSGRTYKSALIWVLPDTSVILEDEARKFLAWKDIDDNEKSKLSESQLRELAENLKKSRRDLSETIWRTYKFIALLARDNSIVYKDLGLVHSSSSENIIHFIINRLKEEDEITTYVNPNYLVRFWPPAKKEWSTKSLRDMFYASPVFPRLMNSQSLKDTISKGVSGGLIAYIGKTSDNTYEPFYFNTTINIEDIEFSDDMFIVTAEEAKKHIEPPKLTYLEIYPTFQSVPIGQKFAFTVKGKDQRGQECKVPSISWRVTGGVVDENGVFTAGSNVGEFSIIVDTDGLRAESRIAITDGKKVEQPEKSFTNKKTTFHWQGDIPSQKWQLFYMKVIAKHAASSNVKINVNLDIENNSGLSDQAIEEIKSGLKDLGLKTEN